MNLTVDTNIILKALIKRSKVRAILLNPNHQFHLPEYALEEFERHLPLVTEKTSLPEEEIRLALNILLTNIQIVPSPDIQARWKDADRIMGPIDKDDIPFIAAALSIRCDGI